MICYNFILFTVFIISTLLRTEVRDTASYLHFYASSAGFGLKSILYKLADNIINNKSRTGTV